LPFAPGATFKCTQGYNGKYSHQGSDLYAIDFKMPVGTPIHAARGGVIAKIKDVSSKGGADRKYSCVFRSHRSPLPRVGLHLPRSLWFAANLPQSN